MFVLAAKFVWNFGGGTGVVFVRLVVVTGRKTVAVEGELSRGGVAARCGDRQYEQRWKPADTFVVFDLYTFGNFSSVSGAVSLYGYRTEYFMVLL